MILNTDTTLISRSSHLIVWLKFVAFLKIVSFYFNRTDIQLLVFAFGNTVSYIFLFNANYVKVCPCQSVFK